MSATLSLSAQSPAARRKAMERQVKAAIAQAETALANARQRASQPGAGPSDLQHFQHLQVQLSSLERQLRRIQAGVYDQ